MANRCETVRNFIFNKWLASAIILDCNIIQHIPGAHTQTIKHDGNVVLVSSFRPIGFYRMSAMLNPEGPKTFLFFCPPHVNYVLQPTWPPREANVLLM
mgnify:CR=1 FL=1